MILVIKHTSHSFLIYSKKIERKILCFQATRPDKRQPSPISPHLLSEPFRPRVQSLDQARPTVLALIVHLNKMAQVIIDHNKMTQVVIEMALEMTSLRLIKTNGHVYIIEVCVLICTYD